MIEEIPEVIRNAVELGVFAALLALLAQFPRLVWLYLLVLAAVVADAFRLAVLNEHWVLDSLMSDAPWGVMAPLLVVAAGSVVAAPRLAASLPGRMLLLAVIPPIAAGHRRMRAVWDDVLPDPRERAGLILLVNALGALVPFFGAAAISLTWAGAAGTPEPRSMGVVLERLFHPAAWPPALGATAVGGLAWWWGRRGAAERVSSGSTSADRPGPPPGPSTRHPLVPVLLTVPLSAVVVWIGITSGVIEFAAQGIEQAPIFLPRITPAILAAGSLLLGGLLDEGTAAVALHEVLARAYSLHDDSVRDTLLVALSVGSGLPMLIATRARLRFGLPFWLLQVGLVLTWSLLGAI